MILFKLFSGNISIKDKMNKVEPIFPHPSQMITECCIELIKMCMQYDPSKRPTFVEFLYFMKQHSFALSEDFDIKMISQRYQTLIQNESNES